MRYVIVGTGARHVMLRSAITGAYASRCELVGLCDSNSIRLALSASKVASASGNGPATYLAGQFSAMLAEQKPDVVVVVTPDFTHERYIVEALRAGCDVITEKPMTTTVAQLKTILDAQRETGRKVMVTHNYRYAPARTQIKQMLAEGVIGDLIAVDLSWRLDQFNGSEYFRRWHRFKECSGGLFVHKGSHHLDLLNWWIGSPPLTVSAHARRSLYRPETAAALGLEGHSERCLTCPVGQRCDFYLDLLASPKFRELYFDAEAEDDAPRDRCVFSDDIEIEDILHAQVSYTNGVSCNYTLCAWAPWQGFEVCFYGSKGELRHRHVEVDQVYRSARRRPADGGIRTQLHLAGRAPEDVEIWTADGEHGGADPIMLGYLFDPAHMPPDTHDRGADHVVGSWAVLVGIAANRSLVTGASVNLNDLLKEAGVDPRDLTRRRMA